MRSNIAAGTILKARHLDTVYSGEDLSSLSTDPVDTVFKAFTINDTSTTKKAYYVFRVYKDEFTKWKIIAAQCEESYRFLRRPILIGTTSIEKSEKISKFLENKKVTHKVLNAKQHEQEAKIIAEAGKTGAVTIATNMAGRGTDIKLGGNKDFKEDGKINDLKEFKDDEMKVKNLGGLFIIGTERHESRRIDNQLRGRSGRQGDPGSTIFFISLQDELMRIFGGESIDGMLKKLGLKENESIDHPWINKAVEKAQAKVEAHNFEIRKQLLKFDDVMNDQRKVIFDQRKDIMRSDNISTMITDMRHEVIEAIVYQSIPDQSYHFDSIMKSSTSSDRCEGYIERWDNHKSYFYEKYDHSKQ